MAESAARLDLIGDWVRVLSLRNRLLGWYDRNARDLPWRRTRDPYHVVVSEFMAQQTRIDVVLPYFDRWTTRWPTIDALAEATEDEVLAAWSGLGYYRRARNLLATARVVRDEHDGIVPASLDALLALPGVGPYTAAAILSIAHDEPVPVLDGNVERVLSRVLLDSRPPSTARKKTLTEAAHRLVTGARDIDPNAIEPPEGLRAGDWNQALMELGALVCTPRDPNCAQCPWGRTCLANRAGMAAELPRRKAATVTREVILHMAIVRADDRLLLVRRPDGALMAGMWELPTTSENGDARELSDALAAHNASPVSAAPTHTFRHAITTRRITVHVHEWEAPNASGSTGGVAWVREDELSDYGVSSMTQKALAGG